MQVLAVEGIEGRQNGARVGLVHSGLVTVWKLGSQHGWHRHGLPKPEQGGKPLALGPPIWTHLLARVSSQESVGSVCKMYPNQKSPITLQAPLQATAPSCGDSHDTLSSTVDP